MKTKPKKTHITWSIELDSRCPYCTSKTILVVAPNQWSAADEKKHPDYIEVDEEVSGHYCPECRSLISLSLNT